jgi:hypothetical protein
VVGACVFAVRGGSPIVEELGGPVEPVACYAFGMTQGWRQ